MRSKLKMQRLRFKLTQAKLAEHVGIARTSYTNIELGNKTPSLEVALKIKDVLSYEKDDLFDKDE